MSSHLQRSDLDPILGGYLVLMLALAGSVAGQRRAARSAGPRPARLPARPARGWRALAVHVLADAAGGYLLLAAVVVGYYFGVARVGSDFLASAFTGSALLLAVAAPLWALASWLSRRRARRRPGP